jgi:hypothetical protein
LLAVCRVFRIKRDAVAQAVADELFFVVAVAAIFLGGRTLTIAFVVHDLAQVAQIAQVFNGVGRVALRHVLPSLAPSNELHQQPTDGDDVRQRDHDGQGMQPLEALALASIRGAIDRGHQQPPNR